ncbi:uncharacterized protein [Haliotis cracherodii]|uniref:uncharacterized protein n=1 Tax=Haliotis cracherodii TaxID=6455 RepID=UPI0039EBC053
MDVLLTLIVLTLPIVISGLQTCSSGTETSSNQIILDVSTTQINTGGGMCSCRLTVSQTTNVDMITTNGRKQCHSSMTIQKWNIGTTCNIFPKSHIVTTGEEIWVLVVATSGARKLSGRRQFKLIPSSGQLNIECFEPNSNSSSTTVSSINSVSTTPSPTTVETTTSQTTTAITTDTEEGSIARTGTIKANSTQILKTESQLCNSDFPGGIFAAGVATCVGLVAIAGGLYVLISRRRWWTSRREKPDDIPVSIVHPTYSGFTSRTEEPSNAYDILDPTTSDRGTANQYINVS